MSLFPGFYSVVDSQVLESGQVQIQVRLEPKHPIFLGHFPGNPITPGVCMLQLIKELVEGQLDKKLFLSEGVNVKFTARINPFQEPLLCILLDITEVDDIQVKSEVYFQDRTLALKLRNRYRILSNA